MCGGGEEEAELHWSIFKDNPAYALSACSFVVSGPGRVGQSGPCTISFATHKEGLERRTGPVWNRVDYAHNTKVYRLVATLGGNGSVHWYPYLDSDFGFCDIRNQAPVGTIALTAAMNGCSLRIYVNRRLGITRFCHDNNGRYVSDTAMNDEGYEHVVSINADDEVRRQRGEPSENINGYWERGFTTNSSQTGLTFMSIKTSPSQWSIFKSVVLCQDERSVETSSLKFWKSDVFITDFHFQGDQRLNGLFAVADIPSIDNITNIFDEEYDPANDTQYVRLRPLPNLPVARKNQKPKNVLV